MSGILNLTLFGDDVKSGVVSETIVTNEIASLSGLDKQIYDLKITAKSTGAGANTPINDKIKVLQAIKTKIKDKFAENLKDIREALGGDEAGGTEYPDSITSEMAKLKTIDDVRYIIMKEELVRPTKLVNTVMRAEKALESMSSIFVAGASDTAIAPLTAYKS